MVGGGGRYGGVGWWKYISRGGSLKGGGNGGDLEVRGVVDIHGGGG